MKTKQITKIYGKDAIHLYRLTDLEYSSRRFGLCEICGKHVSEVYLQSDFKEVVSNGKAHWRQISTTFGHVDCLLGRRVDGVTIEKQSLTLGKNKWTVTVDEVMKASG